MSAHHEQVKDQNGKPEQVVVRVAIKARKILPVQLGWGIFGDAYVAAEDPRSFDDLKRIAINKCDDTLLGYHDVLLLDISDDMPVAMHLLEGNRAVSGGMDEESPIWFRDVLFSPSHPVEVMDLEVSRHLRH